MDPAPIRLADEERAELQARVRATKSEQRQVFRARVILMLADGARPAAVARALHTGANTVGKWRRRFVAQRLRGLEDAPRPGKPKTYDERVEARILAMLDRAPPRGYAKWNGALLAKALGEVSKHQVWRVLKSHDISLERRRSWCVSTDAQFAPKAADIVGLYLNPPEHAVVLCVDEKPSIQALERAQGWLRLPNGKALTGFSHCYKRHGTTTLFAALEVASGLVKTGHYNRRRRREFLDFMNQVIAQYPGSTHPCDLGQPQHAQAQVRPLAQAPPAGAAALHPHLRFLAQPSRDLVQHHGARGAGRGQLHEPGASARGNRRLHRGPQR